MPPRNEIIAVTLTLVAWGSSIAGGTSVLLNYELTPGPVASASAAWPSESAVAFSPGQINIVVLAHPRCPCTRASLNELQMLLDHCRVPTATHVLFWMPSNAGEEWRQTELWHLANRMRGVQTHADEAGAEAGCFGAMTSGHIMIFRGNGTRIFSGGLTTERGRSGDGTVATAICQLINQETLSRPERPVFGCPLFDAPSRDVGIEPCLK